MRNGAAARAMLILGAATVVPGVGRALERRSARVDDGPENWNAGQTCTVHYYNICTGWVWVWSGWSPGDQMGTVFHACCDQAVLRLTDYLTFDARPAGWGFTGTIEVFDVQGNECPTGAPIARQAWLPPSGTGWHTLNWNVAVPQDFLLRINWDGPVGWTNRTGLATDHPHAGPTGPQACGVCYPSDRVVSSFFYGWPGQRYCPGIPLDDGTCDVEWCFDAAFTCPVHTEHKSWGGIKTLYE